MKNQRPQRKHSQDFTTQAFFSEADTANSNMRKLKRPLSQFEIKNADVQSNCQKEEMTKALPSISK
jgi:hypothetical protein